MAKLHAITNKCCHNNNKLIVYCIVFTNITNFVTIHNKFVIQNQCNIYLVKLAVSSRRVQEEYKSSKKVKKFRGWNLELGSKRGQAGPLIIISGTITIRNLVKRRIHLMCLFSTNSKRRFCFNSSKLFTTANFLRIRLFNLRSVHLDVEFVLE